MYIVTGGAGFIGAAVARKLNSKGINEILIVDELKSGESWKNLRKINLRDYWHKETFIERIRSNSLGFKPQAIIHMGACSSTTENNADYMIENNYEYTKSLARFAVESGVRFIYASSAATYGAGENGYLDDEAGLSSLKPLNIYGYSKHLFDIHARREGYLEKICGLKFFNVFGPNEYHKGDMRSVALKSYHQIKEKGEVALFRSHRSDYRDGDQKRDFIYIKDCTEVIWWFLNNKLSGLFNLGSGAARSWNDLAGAVFSALKRKAKIKFIDMPENIRQQYQYFTEADMKKLTAAGYNLPFTPLEDAVLDYVSYLEQDDCYL